MLLIQYLGLSGYPGEVHPQFLYKHVPTEKIFLISRLDTFLKVISRDDYLTM